MIKELEPNVSCSENGECVDAIDWTPDLKFERLFFLANGIFGSIVIDILNEI